MKPIRYVVQTGDSLWSIAGSHYGDPVRWPDLYAYNNRPDIVAMTDRPIVNPDRMVPGQAVFLPPHHSRSTQRRAAAGQATNPLQPVGSGGVPTPGGSALAPGSSRGLPSVGPTAGSPGAAWGGRGAQPSAFFAPSSLSRNPAAETFVNDFAHAFNLDRDAIEIRGEAFSANLFLSGTVSLQRIGQVPLVMYSSRSAENQARSQSAMLLGQLLATQSTRLGLDPSGRQVAYESMLAENAGVISPGAVLHQGVTERGQPVQKATIAIPDFTGRISNHVYLARDFQVEVELTNGPTAGTVPPNAAKQRQSIQRADWAWAPAVTTPTTLIIGAVVDEDAVTAGAGLVDSATTLNGSVAGRAGGMSIVRFVAASPTPVQIGGRWA